MSPEERHRIAVARGERAIELRDSGKLLREVGAELGVSAERARCIIVFARRRRREDQA
jgi:DNA-directed RNA polymerase sigma subunit (sigma70/sigma32)